MSILKLYYFISKRLKQNIKSKFLLNNRKKYLINFFLIFRLSMFKSKILIEIKVKKYAVIRLRKFENGCSIIVVRKRFVETVNFCFVYLPSMIILNLP